MSQRLGHIGNIDWLFQLKMSKHAHKFTIELLKKLEQSKVEIETSLPKKNYLAGCLPVALLLGGAADALGTALAFAPGFGPAFAFALPGMFWPGMRDLEQVRNAWLEFGDSTLKLGVWLCELENAHPFKQPKRKEGWEHIIIE